MIMKIVENPSSPNLIPGSWEEAGMPVFKENDLPDLVRFKVLFPRGHRRSPGERLGRYSGTALRNPPEEKGLLKLGDRSGIGKIGRDRVKREGKGAPPV